jgi:hypothetical protein
MNDLLHFKVWSSNFIIRNLWNVVNKNVISVKCYIKSIF